MNQYGYTFRSFIAITLLSFVASNNLIATNDNSNDRIKSLIWTSLKCLAAGAVIGGGLGVYKNHIEKKYIEELNELYQEIKILIDENKQLRSQLNNQSDSLEKSIKKQNGNQGDGKLADPCEQTIISLNQ